MRISSGSSLIRNFAQRARKQLYTCSIKIINKRRKIVENGENMEKKHCNSRTNEGRIRNVSNIKLRKKTPYRKDEINMETLGYERYHAERRKNT